MCSRYRRRSLSLPIPAACKVMPFISTENQQSFQLRAITWNAPTILHRRGDEDQEKQAQLSSCMTGAESARWKWKVRTSTEARQLWRGRKLQNKLVSGSLVQSTAVCPARQFFFYLHHRTHKHRHLPRDTEMKNFRLVGRVWEPCWAKPVTDVTIVIFWKLCFFVNNTRWFLHLLHWIYKKKKHTHTIGFNRVQNMMQWQH